MEPSSWASRPVPLPLPRPDPAAQARVEELSRQLTEERQLTGALREQCRALQGTVDQAEEALFRARLEERTAGLQGQDALAKLMAEVSQAREAMRAAQEDAQVLLHVELVCVVICSLSGPRP